MGTFGERLQREREMRGITLEEIAEATKIGTRSLRALEEQDFEKLPGGIFNKGFVRAYSKYLGIDEDQAVADYQTAVNEAQAAGKLIRPESAPPILVEDETDNKEPVRIPWGLLILIAFLVVVGFAARSYYAQHGWAKLRRQPAPVTKQAVAQSPTPEKTQAQAVSDSQGANKSEGTSIAATQSGAVTGDPPQNTAQQFVVKVRAKEDAWVEITADGKHVASELMKANSDKVIRAGNAVVLKTGNAGGIEVSRNDEVLPALGTAGVTKTVTITAKDVR